MPAGNYLLTAEVTDPPGPNQWQGEKKIGVIRMTFTVPAVPDGVSDKPLDIGAVGIAK